VEKKGKRVGKLLHTRPNEKKERNHVPNFAEAKNGMQLDEFSVGDRKRGGGVTWWVFGGRPFCKSTTHKKC